MLPLIHLFLSLLSRLNLLMQLTWSISSSGPIQFLYFLLYVITGKNSWFQDVATIKPLTHLFSPMKPSFLVILKFVQLIIYICMLAVVVQFFTSSQNVGDAYLVPNLSLNLISVCQVWELGFEVKPPNKDCSVQDQ